MIGTYNVGIILEWGLGIGLIIGFVLGSTYRGLIDKWKFRNKNKQGG
jgi:hypothetical protein